MRLSRLLPTGVTVLRAAAVLGLLALSTNSASAGYMEATYYFNNSNTLSPNFLGNGQTYAKVTIQSYDGVGATQNGLAAGTVHFSAQLYNVYSSTGTNFGWDRFGFNVNPNSSFLNNLTYATNFANVVPGANLSKNKPLDLGAGLDGYGKFDYVLNWDPSTAPDTTLSFDVVGLGLNATVTNFTYLSVQNPDPTEDKGQKWFGAHVIDFQPAGSHFIGVGGDTPDTQPHGPGTVTPVPPTIVLLGIGSVMLGAAGRFRKRLGV
jgi:hypothetical protein